MHRTRTVAARARADTCLYWYWEDPRSLALRHCATPPAGKDTKRRSHGDYWLRAAGKLNFRNAEEIRRIERMSVAPRVCFTKTGAHNCVGNSRLRLSLSLKRCDPRRLSSERSLGFLHLEHLELLELFEQVTHTHLALQSAALLLTNKRRCARRGSQRSRAHSFTTQRGTSRLPASVKRQRYVLCALR